MRRVLVFSILLLLAIPLVASAEQQVLRADLEHGIVVWSGFAVLQNDHNNKETWLFVPLGSDDVARIKQWHSSVYVVVRVVNVDYYVNHAPLLNIHFYRSFMQSQGDEIWVSQWQQVTGPGTVSFVVPEWVIDSLPSGGARLGIQLYPYWDTGDTAQDHHYHVRVAQVIIAPPQGVVHDQPQSQPHGQVVETSARLSDGARLAIAAGAGFALALLVFIAARRRW